MANRRDRDTREGDQSSSGVGADDRDRQGQRVQDPESPRATGVAAAEPPAAPRKKAPNHGHQPDTGDRSARGEDHNNRRTRSGSRSNAS